MPLMALLALIAAQTVLRHSDSRHDFAIGFATGLLIAFVAASFSIKAVEWDGAPSRSDVDDLRISH